MATPRIFVSSTCYDLQEIRFQLRSFIQEYGYEAVLSELNDEDKGSFAYTISISIITKKL